MGRRPVNIPSDEFRCTAIDDKRGGRCSRPRLPAITLCRIHHLLQLQPIPPTTTTNTTAVVPQPKKRGRPLKNSFPSTAADTQSLPSKKKRGRPPTNKPTTVASDTSPERQQPSNNALTLPSDRCPKNDGKGWRCRHPRIPDSRYCDKHDCRGPLSPPTVKNVGHPYPPNEKLPVIKVEDPGLPNTALPVEKPEVMATLEVGDQLDLTSDHYRCTTTIERCPRPRLPGTTLCRHHHLHHVLIPSTTISGETNPLTTATTAAAQPNQEDRHPTTTTTVASETLPSSRCTRNDGRGWRCSHPCLPANVYCDKHDQYYRRRLLRSKQTQRRSSSAAPATTVPRRFMPAEENVVAEEASAHASITTAVSLSTPLPPTVTGTQAEKQSVVKPTVPAGYMQGVPKRPPPFEAVPPSEAKKKPVFMVEEAQVVTMEAETLELASTTMQVEKPPAVNVNHPKPPPKIFRVGKVWALPAASGGPPRAYARIDRIIQRSRQAEVTLLAPQPITDEEIGWVKDGRTLACGTFRTISHSRVINISSLSHQVAYSEVGKSFKILPKAGEVWAVYDDLETGATYHLAEIVSGFAQDCGVTAARLVLAEGGGFRRELRGKYELRRTFVRRDLLWFSHQVLAVRMAEDAAGCGELWKVFS